VISLYGNYIKEASVSKETRIDDERVWIDRNTIFADFDLVLLEMVEP